MRIARKRLRRPIAAPWANALSMSSESVPYLVRILAIMSSSQLYCNAEPMVPRTTRPRGFVIVLAAAMVRASPGKVGNSVSCLPSSRVDEGWVSIGWFGRRTQHQHALTCKHCNRLFVRQSRCPTTLAPGCVLRRFPD
jgi:hypothetical protein